MVQQELFLEAVAAVPVHGNLTFQEVQVQKVKSK